MLRWFIIVLCLVAVLGALPGDALADDTKPAATAAKDEGKDVIPVQVVTDLDGHRLMLTGLGIVGLLLAVMILQLNQLKSVIEKNK